MEGRDAGVLGPGVGVGPARCDHVDGQQSHTAACLSRACCPRCVRGECRLDGAAPALVSEHRETAGMKATVSQEQNQEKQVHKPHAGASRLTPGSSFCLGHVSSRLVSLCHPGSAWCRRHSRLPPLRGARPTCAVFIMEPRQGFKGETGNAQIMPTFKMCHKLKI